jgi:hypothetical protein
MLSKAQRLRDLKKGLGGGLGAPTSCPFGKDPFPIPPEHGFMSHPPLFFPFLHCQPPIQYRRLQSLRVHGNCTLRFSGPFLIRVPTVPVLLPPASCLVSRVAAVYLAKFLLPPSPPFFWFPVAPAGRPMPGSFRWGLLLVQGRGLERERERKMAS